MKKLLTAAIIIIGALYCGDALAAGTTGFSFLKVSPSARVEALGGGGAAYSDDLYAMFYNPAGLFNVRKRNLSLSHMEWLEGIRMEYAGFALPLDKATLGVSVMMLNAGDIDGYDRYGAFTSKFQFSDFSMKAGFAVSPLSNIKIGALINIVNESADDINATGFCVDAGALMELSPELKVGVSLVNMGPQVKYDAAKVGFPAEFKGGASLSLMKGTFNVFGDVSYAFDGTLKLKAGGEYVLLDILALRAGYRVLGEDFGKLSAGAGIKVKDLKIDYAFTPFGDMGLTHRVNLSFSFGRRFGQQAAEVPVPAVVQAKPAEKPPVQPPVETTPSPAPAPVPKPAEEKKELPAPPKVEQQLEVPLDKKVNIAVMDLEGKNVSAMDASVVSEFLRNELILTKAFRLIEKNNMDSILSEQAFQQSGCTSDECAIQVGKLLNIQQIVVGSFSKLMGTYYIAIRLVDVEKGDAITAETVECESTSQFKVIIKDLAMRIARFSVNNNNK